MSGNSNATRPARPPSAVSSGVGFAGLAGMFAWLAVALHFGMDGPYAALCNVVACAIPMILWSLVVDKVHRNPSTGIDWDSQPRTLRSMFDTSVTKLAGLWATWALIAFIYCVARFYWQGSYQFSMQILGAAAIPLVLISVPYIFWLDRRLINPRDGAWALGAMLIGRKDYDDQAIYAHFRSWAVKAFFLAFMISIVPAGFRDVINGNFQAIQTDPIVLAQWLIVLMFVVDVGFATAGYILTLRPLDAHIRSATPYAAGWVAALICYPPFLLMDLGGPLNYRIGGAEWGYWLAGHPALTTAMGILLVFLTAIYAWATVAFGIRFSNLTDRGILTHGPYAFTKHPAYLSKNLFWWFTFLPFLVTTGSITDLIRNTTLLGCVSGIYYWRAKTEERHLSADPAYAAYAEWMAQYGLITRLFTSRHVPARPDQQIT